VHLWSGLVAGPLFLVLALSGTVLVFAPEIDAAIRPPGHAPERSPLLPLRSLHASLHAGRAGAMVVGLLGLALVAEGVTGVWLYGPALRRRPPTRTIHRILGGVSLAFAAVVGVSGALLAFAAALATTDALPPGLRDALQRLHYGDFAGWPSRILYAAVGVAVPVLSITGFLIVLRRQG
jgi:uncharacterized iron-regulated membrane protein